MSKLLHVQFGRRGCSRLWCRDDYYTNHISKSAADDDEERAMVPATGSDAFHNDVATY